MNQKSDSSDRRILTFPAIHPCQSIAQMTLVVSLVNLAHKICGYRSRNIAVHKRNIREVIRQVGVLQIFLEEIRDRRLSLPHSIVLCFFELHLAFQKLCYLLEDCHRQDARLWILMKSKRISFDLREVMTSVATALDVLPMNSVHVSDEVKELIELVAKQAQRAKFGIDIDDQRAMACVNSILNKFERRVSPDLKELQRVVDYLDIRSWSDCNKEVKFLDEEINIASLNGELKELELLGNLMAFMCYCRAVVFDTLDSRSMDQIDARLHDAESLNCLNPEDFRCPISLEIMKEPVTISTGQTYEKSSITKWFKAKNHTCPKTGEKLTSMDMVPNSSLQKLIKQYCFNNGVIIADPARQNRDITGTVSAGSPAAAGAMKLLSKFLTYKLAVGMSEDKNKAANEIRMLAKASIFNRACLMEAGAIPYLLHLLSSMDASVQENSIAAILNLSKHSASKDVIAENGGVIFIVEVLIGGVKMETRQLAAAALFYLASVEEYRRLIGETPEAIEALVELMRNGSPRGKKNAVVAIFGLVLLHENQKRVLQAGAVPLLVDLLTNTDRTDLVTDSLAVLATLAESAEGTKTILNTSAVPLLIGILQSSTSKMAKEYCVSIILSLCVYGGVEAVSKLQKSSSLMASLYSLLTEGTSRANKKASTILKIIHEFNNANSGLPASGRTHERFVQVR